MTATVAHDKLPQPDLIDEWKFYWTERLGAIDTTGRNAATSWPQGDPSDQ